MDNLKIKNPFQEIYESPRCKKPYSFPLLEFPLLLDVELTNCCNLDCIMCPGQIMTRKVGFMTRETFAKIVDEAKGYKPGIRFIRCGEPFLNKEIFSFINQAKRPDLIVHFTTNGLLLNDELLDKIFNSELDNIIFSLQGVDKSSYQEMRNNKQYDELKEKISRFKIRRDKEHRTRPFIQITTTF